MQAYMATGPYQRLLAAVRNRDYALAMQVIDAQIRETASAERAFWLFVRTGVRAAGPDTPRKMELAWDDLEHALRSAPDDPQVQERVLVGAMHIVLNTERPERLITVAQLLRPQLPRLKRNWAYCCNVGFLHKLTGRWAQAHAAMNRSVAGFPDFGEEEPIKGYLPRLLCWRAVTAVANGLYEQAAQDIATAEQLFEVYAESARCPVNLALAKGELALGQGQFAVARSHLQSGVARSGWVVHVSGDPTLIRVDLLAARISRAEGNQAGFGHFAEKALARSSYHDLPMSAALIRRVIAGAER